MMFGLAGCYATTCDTKPILKGTWEMTDIAGYEVVQGDTCAILFDDTFKGVKYQFTDSEVDMFSPEGYCDCRLVDWSFDNGYISGELLELDAGDWICYEGNENFVFQLIRVSYDILVLRNFCNNSEYGYNYLMTFQRVKSWCY